MEMAYFDTFNKTLGTDDFFAQRKVRDAAAAYEQSKKTAEDAFRVGTVVAAALGHELEFASVMASSGALSPEAVAATRRANCYAAAILLSETLEQIDITHYIAFVNSHAFVWLADEKTSYMLDGFVKEFNCETSPYITTQPPKEWQLGGGPLYIDGHINTLSLLYKTGVHYEKHPWLRINEGVYRAADNDVNYVPMRVYPSIPGRGVLENFYNSLVYSRKNNPVAADIVIEDLAGTYPDVDPKNKMESIKNILKIVENDDDRYVKTAAAYEESLAAHDKTIQRFLLPDAKRRVGKRALDVAMLESALELYQKAPFGGAVRRGKIQKTLGDIAWVRASLYENEKNATLEKEI